MLYAFDLDGTLIDSHDAVLQAYRDVGVNPPLDFFTRPWQSWLKDRELHIAKNRRYLQMINAREVNLKPIAELYLQLTDFGHETAILTGASEVATHTIITVLLIPPTHVLCELTVEAKIEWMNAHDAGIMFEDQLAHAHKMRKETQWTICHAL